MANLEELKNYCDSYHLPWVHPELNIISKLEDHYNIQEKNEFSGQGSYVYRQIEHKGNVFYDFDGLSSK